MADYLLTTDPATWSDQEWVDHCNRVIALVLQGRDVLVNGKQVRRSDLDEYRRELQFREARLARSRAAARGRPARAPIYLRF